MASVEAHNNFVSAQAASPDSAQVDGPKWNDPIVFDGGTDGQTLVYDSTASASRAGGTGTVPVKAAWMNRLSPVPVTSNDQIPNGEARLFDGDSPRVLALRYNDNGTFRDIASITVE